MNDLNNLCINLYKNKKIKQALEGWSFILEAQKDHLYAFFNYNLVNSLGSYEDAASKRLFMELKPSRMKEYFKFLFKIRSRNSMNIKKHQIPNHLLYEENRRSKIVEFMKFLDLNKKNFKRIRKKTKGIRLQEFFLYEKFLCSFLIKESMKLIIASKSNQISNIVKFSHYNPANGSKISEITVPLPKENMQSVFYEMSANKEALIFWTNEYLILMDISISLRFLSLVKVTNIMCVKFNISGSKSFVLVQKDLSIKILAFPSMKTLETILNFSFENSKFSCFEISNHMTPFVIFAQEETLKLYASTVFQKEIKIQGKGPIKCVKFLNDYEKNNEIVVLSSNTFEILSFSKGSSKILAQGLEIENLNGLKIFNKSDLILGFENNHNTYHIKLFCIKNQLLAQNFTIEFPFNGLFFLEDIFFETENYEFAQILYLDNHGLLKTWLLDIDEKQNELIRLIWQPEEVQFEDLNLELKRNYNDGLRELVEFWRNNSHMRKEFDKVFEIAENGKFFWDYKQRNEIKTLFLELNNLKSCHKKINDSSDEANFDDFTKVSAFVISSHKNFLALSELRTNFIKIIEIDEAKNLIRLKNVLEFNYGQILETPHQDFLLFSQQINKNSPSYLFYSYNDLIKSKCLGLVIWDLNDNRIVKKLGFNDQIMQTLGFSDKLKKLYCFFGDGNCFFYDFSTDETGNEEYLCLESPYYIIVFNVEGLVGIALSTENLLRIFDLKRKILLNILYLTGEPLVFWSYDVMNNKLYILDCKENFQCFKDFNNDKKSVEKWAEYVEKKNFGDLYAFDVENESGDLVGIYEEGEIVIINLKEKKKNLDIR